MLQLEIKKRSRAVTGKQKNLLFFLLLCGHTSACAGILWQINELVLFRITLKQELNRQDGQAKKGQIEKLCRCVIET